MRNPLGYNSEQLVIGHVGRMRIEKSYIHLESFKSQDKTKGTVVKETVKWLEVFYFAKTEERLN